MQPNPTFGFDQIAAELIRGVFEAVAQKPHLSPTRQASIERTVACTIMAHAPRDPVETVMAGQCVVYDHLLRDGARELLRGNDETAKVKARPGILAAGKMFLMTVDALAKMQGRPADQLAFTRDPEPLDEASAHAEPAREAASDAVASGATPARPASAAPILPATQPTPAARPTIVPPAVPPSAVPPNSAVPAPDPDQESEPDWSEFEEPPLFCFDKIEDVVLAGMTPEDRRLIRETLARGNPDETDEQAAERLLGLQARLAQRSAEPGRADVPEKVLEDAGGG